MSSPSKFCKECGAQLDLGLARCVRCGAQVGTVFSEPTEAKARPGRRSWRAGKPRNPYESVQQARERANNAFIMALGSFFCPVIGLAVGAASIVLGFNAIQTLRAHHVEEGRGSAIAAMVIGALGLFAQAFYTIYLMNEGLPLLGP